MSRVAWLALSLMGAACTSGGVDGVELLEDLRTPQSDFEEAASTWDVPSDLLMAIAVGETGMQMVVGEEEFEGWAPAFGVMALRGDNLELGAELAGLPPERVRTNRRANVMAAAALLRSWADELDLHTDDLSAWAPVVARYSGIASEEGQAEYVWDAVYKPLREGIELEGFSLAAQPVLPAWPEVSSFRGPGLEFGAAQRAYAYWRPSPNYSSRSGYTPQMVVIHACEGAYSGCWSWLTNSASGVSAHYVVNETGSDVSQLVTEANKAWHVSASYDCTRNGNSECNRNGTNVNYFSVGIEHAGYSSQANWNTGLIAQSAQLTCDITRSNNIARDSYHIVAHGRLQPYNRTDPGAGWPWTDYLNRVNTACGAAGGGGGGGAVVPNNQFVIDSNNASNPTATRYVSVSNNWWSSTSVAGYYNTGYFVTSTSSVADGAHFYFNETTPKCYLVEAWWTAAGDRSRTAPFISYNASGTELGRRSMNQQSNGGRWNTVGTYRFTAGWNDVMLSRWTTSGYYVIADAVRLTSSTACP